MNISFSLMEIIIICVVCIFKGFVLGGISAWCYDAIIAKLKGFFK